MNGPTAADLASVGPFFAIDLHGASEKPGDSWHPLAELLTDPEYLDSRISTVARALTRDDEVAPKLRNTVAASVAHLGIAARIVAPALALGRSPFRTAELRWQRELSGAFALSAQISTSADTAGSFIDELTETMRDRYRVSAKILWGNVASAINSAGKLFAASQQPGANDAYARADKLLRDTRLDGGVLRCGPGFRRRSCCQIYRIAGTTAAVCGDCVLGSYSTQEPL